MKTERLAVWLIDVGTWVVGLVALGLASFSTVAAVIEGKVLTAVLEFLGLCAVIGVMGLHQKNRTLRQ